MLKIDIEAIDQEEVEALLGVTEQFVRFAETLLQKGDISQKEFESMTSLKKRFLEDARSKYI